jgi:hypothetical protein
MGLKSDDGAGPESPTAWVVAGQTCHAARQLVNYDRGWLLITWGSIPAQGKHLFIEKPIVNVRLWASVRRC